MAGQKNIKLTFEIER